MSTICTRRSHHCLHQLTPYFQTTLPIVRITLTQQHPILQHPCDKPLSNSHPSFIAFATSIPSTLYCLTDSQANVKLTYRSPMPLLLLGVQTAGLGTPLRPQPQAKRPKKSFAWFVPFVKNPITLLPSAGPTVSPTYLPYRSKINSFLETNFTILSGGSSFTPPGTVISFVSSIHIGYYLIKSEHYLTKFGYYLISIN